MPQSTVKRAFKICLFSIIFFLGVQLLAASNAKIVKIKGSKGLIRSASAFQKGDLLDILNRDGDDSGAAIILRKGKSKNIYVVKKKSGQWKKGYTVIISKHDSAYGKDSTGQNRSSNRNFNSLQLGHIGSFTAENNLFAGSALGAGYDYVMPIYNDKMTLRAGFSGSMYTLTDQATLTDIRYNLFSLEAGIDYLLMNTDFIAGVGGRLGYTFPMATIIIGGSELPFTGENSLSYAVSLFAHYRFLKDKGYMIGAEYRIPFFADELAFENASYFFITLGKSM